MSEDSSLFYFNKKTYSLPSTGEMKINGKKLNNKEFFFTYDAGRGSWPIKSGWVWINANGLTKDGDTFGFNAGHGFTHPSAKFTEHAFFINGKLHKIFNQEYKKDVARNRVGFHDYVFEASTEKTSSCELVFSVYNYRKENKKIVVADVSFAVSYGSYTGTCYDEVGNKYKIKEAYGVIEEKMSVW